MKLEFFFENEHRRFQNFQNLIRHIDAYLKEHPDLEFNKVEHCDQEGYEVYALVSFREKQSN